MKIISTESTELPLTNVEVFEWVKEKNFFASAEQLGETKVKAPKNTQAIVRHLLKYFETSPSAIVRSESVAKLFDKLKPYNLTPPELIMIANLRPDAYAHLTPLIIDVYSRYEENQLIEILNIINTTLEPRTRDGVTPTLPQIETDTNGQEQVEEGDGEPSLNDTAIDETAAAEHTHKVGDPYHDKDAGLRHAAGAARNSEEAGPGLRSKQEDVLLEKSHAPSSQSKDDSQDMSVDDSGAAAGVKKSLSEQSSKDNKSKDKDKYDPMDIDWTIFTDTGEIDAQTTELKYDRPSGDVAALQGAAMMMGNAPKAKKGKSLLDRNKGIPLLHAGINDISVGLKPSEEEEKGEKTGDSTVVGQTQQGKSQWDAGITDISEKPPTEKEAGTVDQGEQAKSPMDAGMTNDIS